MKNSIIGYLFFGIFALAGIICGIVSASLWYARYQLMRDGEKTTGQVVELQYSRSKGSTTTAPVIAFTTPSGRRVVYRSNFYTNINPFQVGDTVTLWYDRAEPEKVVLEKSGMTVILLTLLFLFTHGGVGIGGLVWLERKRRLRRWLQEYGQEIKARFVRANRANKRGYNVECTWTDPYTQQAHTFTSDSMSKNPEDFIPPNGLLRVLIDPGNPKRYWVQME